MLVLPPQVLDQVARRIERAYRLRKPGSRAGVAPTGVWEAAARSLIDMHRADPALPLDPELFVATQKLGQPWSDPWSDLAGECAQRRYRQRIRRIVRQLRRELRIELRRARGRARRGMTVEALAASSCQTISPLGRYIAAQWAGRTDLMDTLREAAADQHWACPLYRQACAVLMPPSAYPVQEVLRGWEARMCDGETSPVFSLN
jgi:hypothetical protein